MCVSRPAQCNGMRVFQIHKSYALAVARDARATDNVCPPPRVVALHFRRILYPLGIASALSLPVSLNGSKRNYQAKFRRFAGSRSVYKLHSRALFVVSTLREPSAITFADIDGIIRAGLFALQER